MAATGPMRGVKVVETEAVEEVVVVEVKMVVEVKALFFAVLPV